MKRLVVILSQCPVGHFCFLSGSRAANIRVAGRECRNALSGIFVFSLGQRGALTPSGVRRNALSGIFVFSHWDDVAVFLTFTGRNALSGIFVFSQKSGFLLAGMVIMCRNALSGIFVFSPARRCANQDSVAS